MSFYFSNINDGTNPIENFIQLYKRSESNKLVKPVQDQRSLIQSKNSVFTEIKTKLDLLLSVVKELSLTGASSKFQLKSAVVSNLEILSATADPSASISNHSIYVQQLAKEDTLVSSRFSSSGSEIVSAEGTGIKTIRVLINGTSTDVNVIIDVGDTNQTILNKIASAINSSVNDVSASVISDTASTSKLIIKSKRTGSQFAISLQDVSGTLLEKIGLDASVISTRTSATETSGGYIYSDVNLLDAKIIVDGIAITRSSNVINDVIQGVTLELKKAQSAGDSPVSLSIQVDKEKIREAIENFIKNYNAVINYINDKTKTTADGTRAIFSGDYMLSKIKYDLRLKVSDKVSSVSTGNPAFLAEIGIKINVDGTLSISDSAKLDEVISNDVSKIESLFNSTDGVAVKLKEYLNPYVQIGGVIDVRIQSGQNEIKRLDDRISSLNKLIDERAERLRKELAQLQSLYFAFVRQQSMVEKLTAF